MSKQVLIDLLTRLSQDPAAVQEYTEDPQRMLAGLDLTEEEVQVLLGGNVSEIEKYLGFVSPGMPALTLGHITGVARSGGGSGDDSGGSGDSGA